jgi:hypothetical protein
LRGACLPRNPSFCARGVPCHRLTRRLTARAGTGHGPYQKAVASNAYIPTSLRPSNNRAATFWLVKTGAGVCGARLDSGSSAWESTYSGRETVARCLVNSHHGLRIRASIHVDYPPARAGMPMSGPDLHASPPSALIATAPEGRTPSCPVRNNPVTQRHCRRSPHAARPEATGA